MNTLRLIIGLLNAICLIVLLFALSIQAPALGFWFYRYQFNKNDTYNVLKMDEESLHHVARSTIAYLRGRTETLADTLAVVDGRERLFYTELEASHMDDVRVLFDYGLLGRNLAAVGFSVTLAASVILGRKYGCSKAAPQLLGLWRWFAAGCLTAFAILAGLIAINFDRAFIIFHEIFFVDNWTFDPRTSLMINMLPNQFFQDVAAFILAMLISLLIITIVAATVLRKVIKKHAG